MGVFGVMNAVNSESDASSLWSSDSIQTIEQEDAEHQQTIDVAMGDGRRMGVWWHEREGTDGGRYGKVRRKG
jgi:hypothetical protein